jgi:hypothetical protein
MCGIVGIYSPTSAVDSEELQRAARRLTHRGPDGRRTWLAPDHRVGLGHARLSIIDLATGDQPIASEDASVLGGPGPRGRPPVSSERGLVGPARFRDAFRGHGPGITKAVTTREHES